MKVDIPESKRCCFCLPLRYGLLVWGYFKLIADALIISTLSYSLIWTITDIRISRSDDDFLSRIHDDLILPVIAVAIFIADFMMTIVFIVGGHKKNVKLIRGFYFISIAMWIFTLLMICVLAVLLIQRLFNDINFWERLILTLSFYFLTLVIQTYFIILLRSEIIKLKNIGEFRFVNNATEAECTIEYNDGLVDEEKETEDVCSKETYETEDESNGTCQKGEEIAPREKTKIENV